MGGINITKEIMLTMGKIALVDDEDYEELNKYKWHANKHRNTYYAIRKSVDKESGLRKGIKMHRFIMNPPEKMQIDHINGDGLDNRKENLRVVTNRENAQNLHIEKTSRYPGVYWCNKSKRWMSQIKYNNKTYHLGSFKSEELARSTYIMICEKMNDMTDEEKLLNKNNFPYNCLLGINKSLSKTSKYRGVAWRKDMKKWQVFIRFKNKTYHLGYFEFEKEAADQYLSAKKLVDVMKARGD